MAPTALELVWRQSGGGGTGAAGAGRVGGGADGGGGRTDGSGADCAGRVTAMVVTLPVLVLTVPACRVAVLVPVPVEWADAGHTRRLAAERRQ